MTIRGLVTVTVGIVAFVIIDEFIRNSITGTDTGSVLIRGIIRIVIAASIAIGVVMNMGRAR